MELATVVHVLCTFVTFCAGGVCEDHTPYTANLRFQDGHEIGEFWTTSEFAAFPWPAVVISGDGAFDTRTHLFVSGQISGTYLFSVAADLRSATMTSHLLHTLDGTDASAVSAQGTCTLVEGEL